MNNQDFIPIKKKPKEENKNLLNNSQSLNNNQDLIYFANSLSGNNIDKKISENNSNNNKKIENQSNLNELNNFQELKEELATQPVNNLHTNPDSIFNNKQDNLNNQLNDNQIESFNMKNNFDNLNISNSNQEQSNNSNNNLADNEILKVAKTLKNDMLIIGILYVIVIIGLIFFKSFALDNIMTIISLIFVVITYLGASDKEWYAGRLGLIIGILMTLSILSFNIIDCILGVFLIIHSVKYNKLIKSNWKKNLFLILSFLGVYIGAFLIIFFLNYQTNKLECTRSNGEQVLVRFNDDGITNVYINDEKQAGVDLFAYKMKFVSDFAWISLKDEDIVKDYIETVREYEEENGSVCK